MKNLFTVFLLLISAISYAQFSYGIKAGLNLNRVTVSDDNYGGVKTDLGYHVGVYGNVPLGEKISFIPELQFNQKGYRFESGHVHLNYLDLPLMLCWRPEKLIGLEFGPGVSFKLAARMRIDGYSADLSSVYQKNIDAGLNFGMRVFTGERVSLIVRYYLGITPIDETYYVGLTGKDSSVREYNRNLQFSIAYSL